MRRVALLSLGLLEIAVAVTLVLLAGRLPDRERVANNFARFETVARGAEGQIASLQGQLADLQRPELQSVARNLGTQTSQITQLLRNSQIDFTTLEATSRGLGEVANGLDGWAATLDPGKLEKLGDALGAAATFLDTNLVESSQSAAAGLEQAIAALKKDAQQLAALLSKAPPDLQAARDIHDSLARFDAGLGQVTGALKLDQFGAIREGVAGLETSLSTTATQVDRMAGFTYPIVTINGFKPNIEQKPFWPEGATIAEGLRKAVKGMQAAGGELDGIQKGLPAIRTTLDESRKVVARTREAMGKALAQQGEIEALLKEVPKQSADLAERLPKIGEAFAKMLRETKRMKEVAAALRQTQTGLNNAATQWPRLKDSLVKSAVVLRTTQGQFDKLLKNKDQYERALKGTTELAARFSELLPVIHERLDDRLSQQERTLGQLKDGLTQVNAGLPEAANTTGEILSMTRWLMFLVGGLVGLHGLFVGGSALATRVKIG